MLLAKAAGHFRDDEPIHILEHNSQNVTLDGRWATGGWQRALKERNSEAWLGIVVLPATIAPVVTTWPGQDPEESTLEGYRQVWLGGWLGRLSAAAVVTAFVSVLTIVFHYWESARHKGIKWEHR